MMIYVYQRTFGCIPDEPEITTDINAVIKAGKDFIEDGGFDAKYASNNSDLLVFATQGDGDEFRAWISKIECDING